MSSITMFALIVMMATTAIFFVVVISSIFAAIAIMVTILEGLFTDLKEDNNGKFLNNFL